MSSVVLQRENVQYAALPWRKTKGVLEILLVRTLTTKRWIVPKGWPVPDLSPAECAAREALEEAGVLGEIAAKPIGSFLHEKRVRSGEILPCKVHVFALEVARQRRAWHERNVRETCWCSLDEALTRVTHPGLRRLIAKFGKASLAADQREGSLLAATP